MATDYFTMMRDAVGSYGEGLDLARARRKSDAEEARKETLFNQEQEQYQRKRGIQQGTDAAFGSYKALQNGVYDGSKADFGAVNPAADAGPVPDVAPIGAVGGGAIPKRAASRRDMLDARKNIAVAAQDYGSLGKLEEESRGVEWDDTFAKHYKSYSGSPEQIADAAKHINTNSKAITLHEPDKQGFRQMSVVSPDGTATLLKLGKHDQAQLWAASQMMDLDPQKALAIMHGIDKNLAAAVAAENGIVDKVGQHQNTMAYNKGQLAEAQQRTAIAAGARSDANKARERENWAPIGASEDDKGLLFLNRQTGRTEVRPLPAGTSAKDLFAKLTGKKGSSEDGFTKVPEDGSKVRDSRGNVFTYSDGEPIMRGGIAPKERPTVMKKLNLPAQAETLLKWEPGGRYVTVPDDNDTLYDLVNEPDLVRKALDRVIVSTQAAGEMQRRGGFTPRYQAGPEAVMRSNANELARLRAARGLPL